MAIPLDEVKKLIEQALPGAQVSVRDMVGDGDHLQAVVVAKQFEGVKLLQQHQMVLNPLKEVLKGDLHALALKTYSPEQWEKAQRKE